MLRIQLNEVGFEFFVGK